MLLGRWPFIAKVAQSPQIHYVHKVQNVFNIKSDGTSYIN